MFSNISTVNKGPVNWRDLIEKNDLEGCRSIVNNSNIEELFISYGSRQFRPLIYAVYENKVNIVKLLLASNANVNGADNFGYTALHWATLYGYINITELLLNQKGCDITVQTDHRDTALHIAVMNNRINTVVLLLQYMKEKLPNQFLQYLNCKDANGLTALDYARRRGNKELDRVLQDAGIHSIRVQRSNEKELLSSIKDQNSIANLKHDLEERNELIKSLIVELSKLESSKDQEIKKLKQQLSSQSRID